jgi:nucleobase:cation symporter-1, NCS1 family
LNVKDLYVRNGIYEYTDGVNYRAIWSLGIGIAVALLGLIVPPLRFLYDYAWFVGFMTAGAVHYALMQMSTRETLGEEA